MKKIRYHASSSTHLHLPGIFIYETIRFYVHILTVSVGGLLLLLARFF